MCPNFCSFFFVTRPPKGVVATPAGFSMINVLYPYLCYQCIVMILFFSFRLPMTSL